MHASILGYSLEAYMELIIALLIDIAQSNPDAFDLQDRSGQEVVSYMCDEYDPYKYSKQLGDLCAKAKRLKTKGDK